MIGASAKLQECSVFHTCTGSFTQVGPPRRRSPQTAWDTQKDVYNSWLVAWTGILFMQLHRRDPKHEHLVTCMLGKATWVARGIPGQL